jgi:ribosome biogenesis GTPase / thiamine phosphate phosphatase
VRATGLTVGKAGRVPFDSLIAFGWNARWAHLLREIPGEPVPGRVVRHDGVALVVAGPVGIVTAPLGARFDPEPTVGDWVAMVDGRPIAVLERSSLLRRRAAMRDVQQVLAANVDVVLLVCGLDRPVKANRVQRGATLASDAGARPVIVFTKAARAKDPQRVADRVGAANPRIELIVTSVREGIGVEELRAVARDKTVAMVGESGAGKSSIVNALLNKEVAAVGAVRSGDAEGRHTTTTRFLHVLPGGGTLIDSPGIRSIGLWGDADAVADTFADIAALGDGCRFGDCGHDSEPDCAVSDAVAEGTLPRERLAAWRALAHETEANANRRRSASRRTPKSRGRNR